MDVNEQSGLQGGQQGGSHGNSSLGARSRRWGEGTFGKLTVLALLVLLLLVPVARVTALIGERMGRQAEVGAEIAGTWGGSQTLLGPVLTVPFTVRTVSSTNGEERVTVHRLHLLPAEVAWTARVEPEIRYRGLFEVVVYETKLAASGFFVRPTAETTPGDEVAWERAIIALGVPDVRGLQRRVRLTWGGREVDFLPGAGDPELLGRGIHAPLSGWGDAAPGDRVPFAFELTLRGSGDLGFVPAGEETRVELSSPWRSPGFTGAFLPAERTIGPEGFTAAWQVPYFGRSYGQLWTDGEVAECQLRDSAFGVSLVLPADAYQQTERAVKYAVLFILLTFGTFFLLELLSPVRLHAVQYLLVGFALCVFYVLLLALGEQLGFPLAYAIAACATAGLIAAYSRSILASRRWAVVVLAALLGLYAFLFVLLRLEDYSLLLGAAGLFAALAVLMRLTRNLDWYSLTFRPAAGDRAP